ncbi:hypothetical protein J5N97_012899 [Dioscorea zingiberensis]|uniref:Uncharacterized protein n=1 Tax=Dioscorea zingiberensis TaxID=325984 RepID=A0A9D5CSD7_9LILI|nr:hypothetical protein J5N97_012899 [Dioscorea zingiberensis]
MTRRCSHCSNNGHNSRTCPARAGGVKLFGVRLTEGVGPMKKSASMGCLSSATSAAAAASPNHPGSPSSDPHRDHPSGYASDDPTHASCSSSCRSERKKGIPWTEEEHRMFLLGLRKLGKGDWRGIARNFVVSRTPTQVASHAQKYFIRQSNATRRKRRSSLFDMVPEMQPMDELPVLEEQFMLQSPLNEPENQTKSPPLHISMDQESESKETSLQDPPAEPQENAPQYNTMSIPIPMVPAFYPAFMPMPLPFWPAAPSITNPTKEEEMGETHEVLRPTPVLPKDSNHMDEVVGMSKLCIGEGGPGRIEPSALSHKLLGASSSRQSAFHINPSISGPDLSQSKTNPIHAV